MEAKKTPKADLESKRGVFLQIGLVVTLTITLLAFNYRSYDKTVTSLGTGKVMDIPEEIIPITEQKQQIQPQAPPPQITIIHVVDDDVEVEDVTIDAEADQNSEIQDYVPSANVNVREEEEAAEMQIFSVVEASPEYPGGEAARMKFLQENIKYPQMARESGIQGTVYVTFVVEKDGRVTDVRILRGIGGGCDEEAVRVVQNMPKWIPGKQRQKPVRVQFNMPIKFTLQG